MMVFCEANAGHKHTNLHEDAAALILRLQGIVGHSVLEVHGLQPH